MKCKYVCRCNVPVERVTDLPSGTAPLFPTWRCPACESEYQLVSDICPPIIGVSGDGAEYLARVVLETGSRA